MTLRHWQMEKVSGSAEPLLSTTGNKGLNSSGGSSIVYDSTALFGKFSVRSKHFFDTDAAGSLADNEFTAAFWFYVPTGTELRYIFQLGLHNTDVSLNGHTSVGLFYSYYSNKIFFTTGWRTAAGGMVELGSLSRNVWHHCYISRTNSGTNSTLQVKITATDGTVVHDHSEVYTKADFSIDESGTGQYSYFNGHPAGGSLTLGNGRIEDFILKNGSVLSYASIYNSSAEVFQSDEPQVSVSTGAGSATLSDSNFTGTKTYSFYDTDATTLLQSGASNSYTSYASSSVAYTALVTDDNNNRVISTFFVSQEGGNNMPVYAHYKLASGSAGAPVLSNAQMMGSVLVGQHGEFVGLPISSSDVLVSGTLTGFNLDGSLVRSDITASNSYIPASIMTGSASKFMLSASFADASGSVIQALNFLKAKVDDATGIGGSGTNNEVAVFSGASTIDSSANLTFDGSAFAVGGTTTVISGSSTMALTPNGAFTLDGNSSVAIESDGGAISVGADSKTGTISVGTAGARTINVGNASATEVQVDAVRMDLNAGSNGLQVDSAGAMTVSGSSTMALTPNGAFTLDGNSSVAIESDGGAISVGADSKTGTISVGTAGARTINVGNASATEVQVDAVRMDLNAGSNGLQVDSAGAMTVSGSSTMALTPNGAFTLDGNSSVAIESDGGAISVGADSKTGTISVGTAGARTINVGNASATEVQVDAVRMDLNAGSNGLQVDSAGAMTVSGSSTMALTPNGAFTLDGNSSVALSGSGAMTLSPKGIFTVDSSAAVVINSDDASSAISIGNDAIGGAINLGTAGARTITVGNGSATEVQVEAALMDFNAGSNGFDLDSTGAINLSGSSTLTMSPKGNASLSSDGTISLSAASSVSENAIQLGAQAGGATITAGINAQGAISMTAQNGGVRVATGGTTSFGHQNPRAFDVTNAAGTSTYAYINSKGATFPVAKSAGYAINASGTVGSLAVGADARSVLSSAIPVIGLLGTDSAGALQQYYLSVSGGVMQVEQA